jgi:hypothetical protein
VDDDDHIESLDEFLAEVLDAGEVPRLPTFLGEGWEPLANVIGDVLRRFERAMVIEVTRSDGTGCYVQFARDDQSIRAELVSNEFLGSKQLPADRISLLLELGWGPPAEDLSPNFSRTFAESEVSQLPWLILQTLHDVYEAELEDTWAVMPPELLDTEGVYLGDESVPVVEPWEITYLEGSPSLDSADTGKQPGSVAALDEGASAEARDPISNVNEAQLRATFQMPKAVTILGRSSSVTNSFVNSIIPVITPTIDEIQRALEILGMTHAVTCCYCGDPWTEWDHLRPIVIDKAPTGYISEIHNLIPACGKCNQSKGNRPWREWMFGNAAKSPKTRGIRDLEERAARLDSYEQWKPPTRLDFAAIVGSAEWGSYWERWKALLEQMRAATEHAARIRSQIAATHAGHGPVTTGPPGTGRASTSGENVTPADGWTVVGPDETVGPIPKNRAVLEAVRACMAVGASPESLAPLLGPANFRAVAGNLFGEELWRAFADTHGKTEQHRRLWFLDTPLQADGHTWVLANNVWGPRTYQLFKELVTLAGGNVSVIQPNGSKVRPHHTGEGMRFFKPGQPIPSKPPLPPRPAAADVSVDSRGRPAAAHATPVTANSDSDESGTTSWTREDRRAIERLAGTDPRWRNVGQPKPGFGRFTLSVAVELAARGLHVRPLAADELLDGAQEDLAPAELLATSGQRQLFASTNDYGRTDQRVWARLKERIGPYPASRELDRVLAEFSVHGPFERGVSRRDGQVWVTIMVRLDDVATALLDLDNVTRGLAGQLDSAGQTT